jgi:4-hydroxy-tetrahydrodipicolinate synthase
MIITGVFAASITPLLEDFSPDLDSIPGYLDFLAERGCHGALLLGTTGEGPSFSPDQRVRVFKAALAIRQDWPEFRLLAGTGTPSLDETEGLTRAVFDLGFDGAVLLPPFYFRNSGEDGLYAWYEQILASSVPSGGAIFGYHIPAVTGVDLSLDLLSHLRDAYPDKFHGLKDSSGDPGLAVKLGNRFGNDFHIFTGNDRLFSLALENGASGCITAAANLISPDLRNLWEDFQSNESTHNIQERINYIRETLEGYSPFPALIKFLLAHFFDFPLWPVCPPLSPLPNEFGDLVSTKLDLA